MIYKSSTYYLRFEYYIPKIAITTKRTCISLLSHFKHSAAWHISWSDCDLWMLCSSPTVFSHNCWTVELKQSIYIEITAIPVDMLSRTMCERAHACNTLHVCGQKNQHCWAFHTSECSPEHVLLFFVWVLTPERSGKQVFINFFFV